MVKYWGIVEDRSLLSERMKMRQSIDIKCWSVKDGRFKPYKKTKPMKIDSIEMGRINLRKYIYCRWNVPRGETQQRKEKRHEKKESTRKTCWPSSKLYYFRCVKV